MAEVAQVLAFLNNEADECLCRNVVICFDKFVKLDRNITEGSKIICGLYRQYEYVP